MKLRQANKQVGRARVREREGEREQQHALLILKSIADWGRYIVCQKGDEEGKGEGDKVLKAIDEFGKQLEFQMSWLNEAVQKVGREGGEVTALDTHCHTSTPSLPPSLSLWFSHTDCGFSSTLQASKFIAYFMSLKLK